LPNRGEGLEFAWVGLAVVLILLYITLLTLSSIALHRWRKQRAMKLSLSSDQELGSVTK
jgi:hypothetical protein